MATTNTSKPSDKPLPAAVSRKRKAGAPAKAFASLSNTTAALGFRTSNSSHTTGSVQQHVERAQEKKLSAKRQKEPPGAPQMHSMQSVQDPVVDQNFINGPAGPDVGSSATAESRLLPMLPTAFPVYNVGGVPHIDHVQSTVQQLTKTLSSSRAQLLATSNGTAASATANHAPSVPEVRSQPSTAGSAGMTGMAGTAQPGRYIRQQHNGLLAESQKQQSVQETSPRSPAQRLSREDAQTRSLSADQSQRVSQHAAAPDAVGVVATKLAPAASLQQAGDERNVEATDGSSPARRKALGQLIARAKQLKEQLDARALRNAAR